MDEDSSRRVFGALKESDLDELRAVLTEEVEGEPLISFGQLNKPDWNFGRGVIPLIAGVQGQDEGACQLLLEFGGADPNIQDVQGLTPAHHAVQLRNSSILQLLISFGADVNISDRLEGRTPLHTLCYSLSADKALTNEKSVLFGTLLDYSDVNKPTTLKKNTVLHIAASKNSDLETVIKPLTSHPDIDMDAMNSDGQTPLIIALESGFWSLASYFIGRGCNLSMVNKHGETSLLIACRKNHVDLVLEMLETNKCPTRSKDSNDDTPFHIAASRGYDDIIRVLIVFTNLRSFGDRNKQGKTPIELALDGQFESIVKLFEERREETNDLLL